MNYYYCYLLLLWLLLLFTQTYKWAEHVMKKTPATGSPGPIASQAAGGIREATSFFQLCRNMYNMWMCIYIYIIRQQKDETRFNWSIYHLVARNLLVYHFLVGLLCAYVPERDRQTCKFSVKVDAENGALMTELLRSFKELKREDWQGSRREHRPWADG